MIVPESNLLGLLVFVKTSKPNVRCNNPVMSIFILSNAHNFCFQMNRILLKAGRQTIANGRRVDLERYSPKVSA